MNDQATLITQALSLHQQGRFDEARLLYEKALAATPDDAAALHLLGVLELQSGAPEKAVEYLQQASSIDTVNAQIFANLGNACFAAGRTQAAMTAFGQSLTHNPNSPETWAGLGNAHYAAGDFEQAMTHYQRALQLNSALADVWRSLAATLLELDQPESALSAIENAEREFAKQGQGAVLPVVMTRGNILMALGLPERALLSFEQVAKGAPEFAKGHLSLGSAHRELGQSESAMRDYERALELDPDGVEGHYALGLLHKDQGRQDDARASLQRVIERDPGHGKAHRVLASLTKYDVDHAHLKAMQQVLADHSLSKEQRSRLHFALGKALEDCALYDDAFLHISEGNRLHREQIRYSIESDQKHLDKIKRTFDQGFMQAHAEQPVAEPGRPIPIFIVGMPRSGTSLTEQILASHPQVHGAGEMNWFDRSLQDVLDREPGDSGPFIERLERLAQSKPGALRAIGEVYIDRIKALSTESRWVVDKMLANFRHVGLIRLALPEAIIVHCRRHPLGTCWSVYKNFLGTQGHGYSFDQVELGQYYQLYRQLMAHWDAVIPGAVHTVDYEELVSNQEAVTRQLLKVCGISWNDACLDFHTTQRPVKTLSASQVRRPIYSDALAQWQHFADHLGPLMNALDIRKKSPKDSPANGAES